MKQFHWNHTDQRGKIHKVGLMHGSMTGHVLIHVNGKISSIDFKVWDTKQYSFFINQELIELNIIKRKDHYEYTMEINEEVKTPLNKKRKEERKKMGFQSLAFVAALLLAIIGGTGWMLNSDWYKEKNNKDYLYLSEQGVFTKGRIFANKGDSYTYSYVVNGEPITVTADANNYPIAEGDEYQVRYLPRRPEVSEVYFTEPTPDQVQRTMRDFINICMQSDEAISEQLCTCMAQAAYTVDQYPGLITLLGKRTPPEENSQFNSKSFSDLTNSTAFKRQLSAECGM